MPERVHRPPELSPRPRLFVDWVVHCRTAHQAHLPGVVGCPLCAAARQLLAGGRLSPQALIGDLEASITAGVLTAQRARQIEEHILTLTAADGQWKGGSR